MKKITIRTYDVHEEDVTGDRYVHLNDLLYYLSKTDKCDPDLYEDLKRLFTIEGKQITGLAESAPAYHPV